MRGALPRIEAMVGRSRPAIRWAVAGSWYGVICALSQIPGTDAGTSADWLEALGLRDLNSLFRMVAHVAVFGVLAVLIYAALKGDFRFSGRSLALAILINAVCAVGDELHQHLVPFRACRLRDVVTDTVAGAAAVLALLAATRLTLPASRSPASPR